MWSRVVEILLGSWLVVGPLVFAPTDGNWWNHGVAVGIAVIVFGLLSFWKPTAKAHLLTILAGATLIGLAYSHFGEIPAPTVQNQVLVGWMLLMFAIIPNGASRPPADYDPELQRIGNPR